MTPRLSPKKSWEGYFAGLFTSVIVGAFFSYAFSSLGPQPLNGLINPLQGAFLGLVIGALAPLGDLGESMFKRQGGLKNSSNIFPGHGGFSGPHRFMDLGRGDWLFHHPIFYSVEEVSWNMVVVIPHEILLWNWRV